MAAFQCRHNAFYMDH